MSKHENALSRCDGCGAPVAADEPAWIEREDGNLRSHGSLMAVERDPLGRIWHVGCLLAA